MLRRHREYIDWQHIPMQSTPPGYKKLVISTSNSVKEGRGVHLDTTTKHKRVRVLAECHRIRRLLGEVVSSILGRAWVQYKRPCAEPSIVQVSSYALCGHMTTHGHDLFPHWREEVGRPSVGSVDDIGTVSRGSLGKWV